MPRGTYFFAAASARSGGAQGESGESRAKRSGGRGSRTGKEDVQAVGLDVVRALDDVAVKVKSVLLEDVFPECGGDLVAGLACGRDARGGQRGRSHRCAGAFLSRQGCLQARSAPSPGRYRAVAGVLAEDASGRHKRGRANSPTWRVMSSRIVLLSRLCFCSTVGYKPGARRAGGRAEGGGEGAAEGAPLSFAPSGACTPVSPSPYSMADDLSYMHGSVAAYSDSGYLSEPARGQSPPPPPDAHRQVG